MVFSISVHSECVSRLDYFFNFFLAKCVTIQEKVVFLENN